MEVVETNGKWKVMRYTCEIMWRVYSTNSEYEQLFEDKNEALAKAAELNEQEDTGDDDFGSQY